VDVHIDQSGDERPARQIDVANVGAPFDRARIGDAADAAVVANEDRGIFNVAPGADIEVAVGGDDRFFSAAAGAAKAITAIAAATVRIMLIPLSFGRADRRLQARGR